MDLQLYNESYDFFCDELKKEDAEVLEVGCGPGNITRYLLSKRPDLKILGTDIAPNMIELGRKNNPSARFQIMDARAVGQLTKKFDAIVCGFCLPYLTPADALEFLADCFNLLNDHGLLYLSFVEGDPLRSGYMSASTGDKSYFYYYTSGDIENELLKKGFIALNSYRVEFKTFDGKQETHRIYISKKGENRM